MVACSVLVNKVMSTGYPANAVQRYMAAVQELFGRQNGVGVRRV